MGLDREALRAVGGALAREFGVPEVEACGYAHGLEWPAERHRIPAG